MSTTLITLTLNISDEFLDEILTTLDEGSYSNYWARIEREGNELTVDNYGDEAEAIECRVLRFDDFRSALEVLVTTKVGDFLPDGSTRYAHFTIDDTCRSKVFVAMVHNDTAYLDNEDIDHILQYAYFGGLIYG